MFFCGALLIVQRVVVTIMTHTCVCYLEGVFMAGDYRTELKIIFIDCHPQ